MRIELLVIFLLTLFFVEGHDEVEAKKKFSEWRCRKPPTECRQSHNESTVDHHAASLRNSSKASLTNVRAMAAKKRETLWSDSDEDDYYDFKLWKKYQREKLRRQRIKSLYDSSSEPSQYRRYYNRAYPNYYRSSYYGYSYPHYGYPSPYPYYGGYGSYGGYGYGGGYGGGYSGSLFSIGAGRQFGVSTPIGGFGISSGFGIGVG